MANAIAILLIGLILGAAIGYILREKKRGAKCIGCPYAKTCGAKSCQGGCSSKID